MFDVLLERPRIAHFRAGTSTSDLKNQRNIYRKAKMFQLDEHGEVCDEFSGIKLPMRSRRLNFNLKMFNVKLNPMHRFLLSRVGQPWNTVYSEITAQLRKKSAKLNFALMHLNHHAPENAIRSTNDRFWVWGPFYSPKNHKEGFYIEPETGFLRAVHIPRKRSFQCE